ncbi:MAG: protein-L-isoaspartate(D-aspartate) O-methyltransferase [Candidatus Promineifilaceae bacterium]|nr:protein-L-isoaspartate(D-aspartate) O-methyltransferase [Candidatus Promineifilaceae bacterium]
MNRWRQLTFVVIMLLFSAACSTPPQSPEAATQNPSTSDSLATPTDDSTATRRESLVYTGIIGLGISDENVIEAMRHVPRHLFVPREFQDQAYANHPLPIGFGQTISQPYIVALMTEAAEVAPGDKVLEVGTGSGYQAAVLAEIVDHVYSVEIIGALVERAGNDLQSAGYDNVTVNHADGYFGWQEFAPFDAIVVTAAPDHVPQPLIRQLKIGGHLIIPVGPVGGVQTLWRITRISENEVESTNLGEVRFVPLTREERQQ